MIHSTHFVTPLLHHSISIVTMNDPSTEKVRPTVNDTAQESKRWTEQLNNELFALSGKTMKDMPDSEEVYDLFSAGFENNTPPSSVAQRIIEASK